jgi:SAM-dependent methyltransferase
VPTPEFLKSATAAAGPELWHSSYDFGPELSTIAAHCRNPEYDLLDIGAAGGELLAAASHCGGRRSALDIIAVDRLKVSENGEMIHGFIDDADLRWSGRPYDVVTALDVFEHLYDPPRAMANIQSLTTPGGIVVIETGNPRCVCPGEIATWYYLAMFEHHIAWSERSIAAIAARFAFEVVSIETKPHKLAANRSISFGRRTMYHLYRLSPPLYHGLQWLGGCRGVAPIEPNAEDHMRVVLRRSIT